MLCVQACIDNNAELATWLLERGAAIDVRDLEGWTPLHAAAHCGYFELAKCVLLWSTSTSTSTST